MPRSRPRPYAEIRVGGLRITAERLPVRLLTALAAAVTSGLGTWLLSGR
ncbi:hypothetical protein ACFYT4_21190 [Streptomyces sp. NPDC004609]